MASHVVVVDSSARRATIRTTPAKALSDVLQEACAKFGIRADNYTLKYNNKPVDLSRTIRLANLPQGAKLDLVQGSRSPAVVNVALQLEQPGQRLTHKFPSNTSLWQVLRVFETIAPAEQKTNLTQRGRAVKSAGSSSAGRLHYEIPAINIMGRELSTFLDLQKTLGQVGLNGGSALLRLQFKDSGEPLEKAMAEITEYFKSIEPEESTQQGETQDEKSGDTAPASAPAPALEQEKASDEPQLEDSNSTMDVDTPTPTSSAPAAAPPPKAEPTSNDAAPSSSTATDSPHADYEPSKPQITDPSTRPMTIFFPPSSSTPTAALSATYDESDYIPTVEHAKSHQAALANATRNQRLASDAELAAKAEATAAHRAAIAGITVRVRLPDGHQLESRFSRNETGQDLYAWVRGLLAASADEGGARFVVRYNSPQQNARLVTLPDDAGAGLVRDLGLEGRVLMTMAWDEDASVTARRGPVLAEKWARRGVEMKVKDPAGETAATAAAAGRSLASSNAAEEDQSKGKKPPRSAEEKESKLRGILGKGLFGKKK